MSAVIKASPATGLFVAIVGPSGAGKDALIRGLAARLGEADQIVFARRVVTRAADAFEDHETLAEAEFLAARAQGRFALSWSAHGLHYGVPREIEARLAAGLAVVCNLSRAAVAEARRLYRPSLVDCRSARGRRRWRRGSPRAVVTTARAVANGSNAALSPRSPL